MNSDTQTVVGRATLTEDQMTFYVCGDKARTVLVSS